MRVLCFNVLATPHTRHNSSFHGGPPSTAESSAQCASRYQRNLALILRISADILCLQEADEAFVALLGPSYKPLVYAPNRSREGCCLLVRVPVEAPGASTLTTQQPTAIDLGSGKSAVFASFSRPGGQAVWLASVHLSGGPQAAVERANQLRRVRDAISAAGGAPPAVVICGDMNDVAPESLILRASSGSVTLRRASGDTHSASGLSGDFLSALRIDHVLVSPAAEGSAGSVEVLHAPMGPWVEGGEIGSDHTPLVFSLNF